LSVLLGAFILSFTVFLVVAVGILAAYGTVIVILNAFAACSPKAETGPVLVSSQAQAAHASGD